MIDWVAMVFILAGYVLNAKKHILCWLSWAIGSGLWIAHWAVLYYSGGSFQLAAILFQVVLLGVNGWGFLLWKRERKENDEKMQKELEPTETCVKLPHMTSTSVGSNASKRGAEEKSKKQFAKLAPLAYK